MNLSDRLDYQDQFKETGVYNPDTEDFSVTYDINGDSNPVSYTIHSMEIEYYPKVVADHIKTHLADKLLSKRGVTTNPADDKAAILKELDVEL